MLNNSNDSSPWESKYVVDSLFPQVFVKFCQVNVIHGNHKVLDEGMLPPGSIIFVFAFVSARGWQPMRDPLFSWFGISPTIQDYKFESYCPMRVDLCLHISRGEYCYYFLLPMS